MQDDLIDHYINGEPEAIVSKITDDQVLYVLTF